MHTLVIVPPGDNGKFFFLAQTSCLFFGRTHAVRLWIVQIQRSASLNISKSISRENGRKARAKQTTPLATKLVEKRNSITERRRSTRNRKNISAANSLIFTRQCTPRCHHINSWISDSRWKRASVSLLSQPKKEFLWRQHTGRPGHILENWPDLGTLRNKIEKSVHAILGN